MRSNAAPSALPAVTGTHLQIGLAHGMMMMGVYMYPGLIIVSLDLDLLWCILYRAAPSQRQRQRRRHALQSHTHTLWST
jgi:hypothetical protein